MKAKRVLPLILSLCMVGGAALAGCKKKDSNVCDGTNHIMATPVSDGESGHHTLTACSNHDPVKGEVVAHEYDATFKCKDCGYQHEHSGLSEIMFKDGTGHYKKTLCTTHRVKKVEKEAHVYDNDEDTTCSKCSYVRVPVHQHTWGAEYMNAREKGHFQMANCEGHTDQKSDYKDHTYTDAADTDCNDCGYTRTADTSVALAADKKIYVVGDSTVCSYAKGDQPSSDMYYLPRYGYGTQLHQYLNVQESQVVNLAISGRSSKSFLTEENYTKLTNDIKEGDYLIIGFGHNDEKSDDATRFASATGDRTVAGSFQNILYEKYVKLAKDKGATPILCTPITRYDASGAYTGAKVHETKDGNYPAAVKELGEDTNTTVIDLTMLTSDLYKADNEAAKSFHAHTSYEGEENAKLASGRDDTHINKYGAEMVCYLFANALKETDNPLAAQVITNKLAPAKGTHYPAAIRTDYVRPSYEEFDPDTTTAVRLAPQANNTMGDWYATVLGDVGGASKVEKYTIKFEEAHKFTVSNTENNGKFSSTADGFGAAFLQVDAKKNFTISAKIKVAAIGTGANDQSGFGIMLRDDIYVNHYSKTILTNYVAAGALYKKPDGAEKVFFSRESNALTKGSDTLAITAGSTYTASITRVGQAVTVKFGDGTNNFEKVYTDFDFVAVDNEYMYVCLFANRGLTVEFTDVAFEITGDSQGA